ncbi:MAG: helix-turn-helix transcriptional regulator [Bacteroidales bacterium]|nr:helix-turn-helix transcriptional regulator [Bacteroidales bacterium]MBQ6688704.1 helix-turn-helix transcriptional regulator [Bacteroidales bacterium]
MDNSSIKNNIRRIRKARKLTQEDMAHKLGISLTAYRDLEKGNTSVVNGHIMKIAMLLNTSTEEIVLGYKPIQAEGTTVEDVHEEYNTRITNYEKRICDLEKIISILEETVRSKNDIILMLKKRLDKEK